LNRGTHEKFENISQSNGENRLHPAVAVRRSDSYFDCDISGAWLHIIRAKLYYKYEVEGIDRLGLDSSVFKAKILSRINLIFVLIVVILKL